MGEGDTAHQVTLTQPFHMGVHEVTQSQYEQVMGSNPSHFKGRSNPVEKVSWDDAVSFCRKLSSLPEEKSAGRVYRLPMEAEWEYACRAGTTTEYSFGDDASELAEYAWFKDNSGRTTHPVGQKRANPWGLYDMHGNVWEWCLDWYGIYPSGPVADPKGPRSGSLRVNRGGSWHNDARRCRSAHRSHDTPGHRSLNQGFRLVLSPSVAATPISASPEIKNSIGMDFKHLPGGTFMMGSESYSEERPIHEVTLSQPFHMGVHEVTQSQYEQVMGSNPSHFKGRSNPVEQVSWDDAVSFCRKLSSLPEEKSAGRVYRLPTEAEWEYACRAGTTTEYSFGDDASELAEYAWFKDNSGRTTHPVGQKRANPWGLYDMHGNVWEWCSDWYGIYPSGPVTDPSGASSGSNRVHRGGSWYDSARGCRSANRSHYAPVNRNLNLGFRLVLSPSGAGTPISASPADQDAEKTAAVLVPNPDSPAVLSQLPTSTSPEIENSIGMGFKHLPGGTFSVGSNSRNLVAGPANGGFESSFLSWTTVAGSASLSRNSYRGSNACLLVGGPNGAGVDSANINVFAGRTYDLTSFVKQTTGTGHYKVTISWQNAAGKVLRYDNDWKGNNRPSKYTSHKGSFLAPENATTARIMLGVTKNTNVLFDEIALKH